MRNSYTTYLPTSLLPCVLAILAIFVFPPTCILVYRWLAPAHLLASTNLSSTSICLYRTHTYIYDCEGEHAKELNVCAKGAEPANNLVCGLVLFFLLVSVRLWRVFARLCPCVVGVCHLSLSLSSNECPLRCAIGSAATLQIFFPVRYLCCVGSE